MDQQSRNNEKYDGKNNSWQLTQLLTKKHAPFSDKMYKNNVTFFVKIIQGGYPKEAFNEKM